MRDLPHQMVVVITELMIESELFSCVQVSATPILEDKGAMLLERANHVWRERMLK